jgi:hypothetical protein
MAFTDDELRSMVRASIARLANEGAVGGSLVGQHAVSLPPADPGGHLTMHASFARFVLQGEGDDGGPCVIEPTTLQSLVILQVAWALTMRRVVQGAGVKVQGSWFERLANYHLNLHRT